MRCAQKMGTGLFLASAHVERFLEGTVASYNYFTQGFVLVWVNNPKPEEY